MGKLTRILLAGAVVAAAMMAWAQAPAAPEPPAKAPASIPTATERASRNAERVGPLGAAEAPIIAARVKGKVKKLSPARLLAEGQVVFDLEGKLVRGDNGHWWTVKHPLAGQLRLLPCPELETIERLLAKSPDRTFSLSGQVYRYQHKYYMLLRRLAPPAKKPPATVKATSQPASPPKTTDKGDSDDTSPGDELRQKLLKNVRPRPIVPDPKTVRAGQDGMSVAPPNTPLLPGPGRLIARRLVRLKSPIYAGGWSRIVFEADNTVREPPLRVMPGALLERLENGSRDEDNARIPGALFYVSGEIYPYYGTNYVLLRVVQRKKNLDRF